ncbi:MAG TPA: dihydrofolate reductase family protein [Acidimicrobiales bacterium]
MRKVIAYELLSLDGVAESPSDFFVEFDEVMRENLRRVISTQDVVLLGRRSYDEWADYWPPSTIEPFASFINGVEKCVVTSSQPEVMWANTTVINGGLVDTLVAMRQQSGGDIGVHGSIALTQSLLADGLIDELRLVIAPALQGSGRKLFEGLSTQLTLTRSITSPSGSLLLDFQITAA